LSIGGFCVGFWCAERGELVVDRGSLRGFCVVIFVVWKCANFLDFFLNIFFDGNQESVKEGEAGLGLC
jgi:hypothetical protein